jgi:mono/diheme cytochrome c family protein
MLRAIGLALFVFALAPAAHAGDPPIPDYPKGAGDIAKGRVLFQQCVACHDSAIIGPNLRGLFQRKLMTDKKTPITDANVRSKITKGGDVMPAYPSLTPTQLDDLIAYLKILR